MNRRILISRLPVYDKWLIGLAFFFAVLFHAIAIHKHQWNYSILLIDAGMAAVLVINIWVRKNIAHPVFFDEKSLYYTKKGTEYIVSFAKIKRIKILSTRYSFIGNLRYMDSDDKPVFIFFYTINWGWKFTNGPLKQLQSLIDTRQPGFKISMTWPYEIF